MADELRRIETLERLVRHLTDEVATLRAELRAGRPSVAAARLPDEPVRRAEPASTPAPLSAPEPASVRRPSSPRPLSDQPAVDWTGGGPAYTAPAARRDAPDFEKLVGRYGTVALAVLTIVMGVGAFLRWAIDHIELGPGVRVGLGALAAAGTAALGWRLRSRGARQYGNTLIGLALALVHVVAWGAGPYLHVVPEGMALALAAAASVALAAYAWREGEQPLFAAGLGGAILAPFVVTRSEGQPEMLLAYGGALVLSGTLALRRGDWRVARRILASGTLLFAAAALAALPDAAPWLRRAEAPAFALAAALVAQLFAGEAHRRALAYGHLASALLVLVAFATPAPHPAAAAALALAGALLAAVASRGEGDATGGWELRLSSTGSYQVGGPPQDPVPWVGAVGFPLAFLGVALFALPQPLGRDGGAVAVAFGVLGVLLAAREWRGGAARRGAHLVAGGNALVAALLLGLHEHTVPLALALAAFAVVGGAVAGRTATSLALVPSMLAVVMSTAIAYVELLTRPGYLYTPFATPASLAAAGATLGWWLLARETRALCPTGVADATDDATVLTTVALAVAFGWGHEELRHAFSPALATFLLVAYYATTGVLAIGAGRARGSATARRVGLALAVLAAIKAIVQASAITSIGLRVGSYLLVGGFLLGVAWWYRGGDAGGSDDPESPSAPSPSTPSHEPASARPVH